MMKLTALIVTACCLLAGVASAQQQATLSFETGATDLKTGQTYEISIRLDDLAELWVADFEVSYDPKLLYIVGTKSGSPVRQGALFAPGLSVVVRNSVQRDHLVYTLSQLAPADPISGGGVVGTFRVYPLAPGKTQLLFSRAQLTRMNIVQTEQGRIADPQPIAFTPVLVELNITGDPVEPPSEATATPRPTETPTPIPAAATLTVEPTLVNVTAAPHTPEPLAPPAPVEGLFSSSPLLIAAVVVMALGAVGMVILGIAWLRSRR